jgi:hypothetical protein
MENKKWTREEAEQNKNNLINELNELPVSKENLEWVVKELDQLIDEEEVRQNKIMNKIDKAYTDLLQDILDSGVKKETRNGGTI